MVILWYLYGDFIVFLWYLQSSHNGVVTEIVPTFSLWKREQKKLRAVSDTQPEDILVIKSKSFL